MDLGDNYNGIIPCTKPSSGKYISLIMFCFLTNFDIISCWWKCDIDLENRNNIKEGQLMVFLWQQCLYSKLLDLLQVVQC